MLPGQPFVLALLIALIAEPTHSAITYMAQCNYDATTGFSSTVVVEKDTADTIFQIAALTSTNTLVTGCAIAQVGTTDEYRSTMTVDAAGSTVNPGACASALQLTDLDTDTIIDEVTFKFIIQTVNGYVFDTDIIFSWKCTKADHSNVIIETFTISSLPVNDLGLKSQLAIELYDTADAKVMPGTVLTLGDSYYIKLIHTYANKGNSQVGIYVNKLTFYEGSDSTTTPNVVAIDIGCKQTVPAYGLSQNFLKESDSSNLPIGGGAAAGGTDGVYVIKSGMFETALWMKSTGIGTTLKVEAVIVQCLNNDQTKCDDAQTNVCAAPGRRRRSAENTGLQNITSVATSFTISLLGGSADQASGKRDANVTMETCYQTYTFWILILVFGILMMLCLIFAVYLFFRLRREKESRRKTEEKYGVINAAF